jgi:uncharacterized membrane protein
VNAAAPHPSSNGMDKRSGESVEASTDRLPEEAQLLEKIAPTLERLPPEERQVVVEMFEASVSHSGLMPPPSFMRGYAELYPEAPKKFFEFAEREVASLEARVGADIQGEIDHRQKNQTYRLAGLFAGCLVSISLIVAGALVAILADAPLTGGFVAIVGVAAGLAGVFVQGRPLLDDKKDETRKQPEPSPKATPKGGQKSPSRTPNKRRR